MNIDTLLLRLSALSALFLPMIVGCTGTDTGNPFTQPLIVDAHSSDPNSVAIQQDLGGTVVTEAWLTIDEIGLVDADKCDEAASVTIPRIGVADHAAADSLKLEVSIPEAGYCKLTLPWTVAEAEAGVPAYVVGSSVYLAGMSPAGTPFVLKSTLVATTSAAAIAGSFELAPDLGGIFLGFDVAIWLDGIDLDSAALVDGVILIGEATNTSLLAKFESNLAAGVELYRDQNNNGILDGPEDALLAKGK